jgi:mannose-6-phosphate isomerase
MDSDQRPWGAWYVLDEGDGYKVKRLDVRPQQRLSYQTHEHRAEHWFVVRGTATCLIDGETVVVPTGGSLDVAMGAAHRITNLQDTELSIIEVQLGSYLGDDDIIRLEDDYGRVSEQ